MTQTRRPVRTRFAPSPTGYLHIGSMRTVLFNWLFARHSGGQFLLRIEDTDRKRFVPGAEEQVIQSINMIGLDIDEGPHSGGPYGPYRQSERLDMYHRLAAELEDKGDLYRCYCSPERLERVNKEKQARKEPPGYDRLCRGLSAEERTAREAQGTPYVMRLAVPTEGETVVPDLIRGDITIKNSTLNDLVLIKSDGYPTYHFAAIVDDHLMEISHVLRGDEWISTAPYHVLLYQFFGWQMPVWVHLPQVLGPDGKKLSKRHGDTAINEYLEKGYLPEALVNFLALVGWSYDETTELMTVDELIERFTLERISPSGGVFSTDKLDWFNGVYIRKLSVSELADRILPFMQQAGLVSAEPGEQERAFLRRLVPLIQERLRVLSEAPEQLDFFFRRPTEYDASLLVPKKMEPAQALAALEAVEARLRGLSSWDEATLEAALRGLVEELGVKAGQLFMAVRVAASGRTVSPPLFETLAVLGQEEALARIAQAGAALRESALIRA